MRQFVRQRKAQPPVVFRVQKPRVDNDRAAFDGQLKVAPFFFVVNGDKGIVKSRFAEYVAVLADMLVHDS